LRGREGLFQCLKEDFREKMVSFKTERYKNFEKVDINNAVFLAYRRYIHRPKNFQAIYEYFGNDLRRMIDFFKEIRVSEEEPYSYLERWMKKRGIIVPASLQ
jgi:hypothetical protein